ncbi:hypothetical protein Chor_006926, partial [Crotalus horridus]
MISGDVINKSCLCTRVLGLHRNDPTAFLRIGNDSLHESGYQVHIKNIPQRSNQTVEEAISTSSTRAGIKPEKDVPSFIAKLVTELFTMSVDWIGFGYGLVVALGGIIGYIRKVTAFTLTTIMGVRFKRTKKLMPAGIIAGL